MLMWLWSGNTKFTTPLPLNFNKFQFCNIECFSNEVVFSYEVA